MARKDARLLQPLCFPSQIIPYQGFAFGRLHVFLRHLATKLPKRGSGPSYQFDDEIRLEYYRLQKISEGSISLSNGDVNRLDGPSEVGTGVLHEEAVRLSGLIDVVNDRFGTDFNQANQLFFDQIVEARHLRCGAKASGGCQSWGTNSNSSSRTCLKHCLWNGWTRTRRFSPGS